MFYYKYTCISASYKAYRHFISFKVLRTKYVTYVASFLKKWKRLRIHFKFTDLEVRYPLSPLNHHNHRIDGYVSYVRGVVIFDQKNQGGDRFMI